MPVSFVNQFFLLFAIRSFVLIYKSFLIRLLCEDLKRKTKSVENKHLKLVFSKLTQKYIPYSIHASMRTQKHTNSALFKLHCTKIDCL